MSIKEKHDYQILFLSSSDHPNAAFAKIQPNTTQLIYFHIFLQQTNMKQIMNMKWQDNNFQMLFNMILVILKNYKDFRKHK